MKVNKLSLFSGFLGVFYAVNVSATTPASLMLCNAGECIEAGQNVTAEHLYNRLGELFTKNVGRKMTFCDADPAIHLCYQQALKMTASSNLLTANVGIDSADVLEVKPSQTVMSLSALLDVSVDANGTYPACETAVAQVNVGSADKVSMVLNGFGCSLTSSAQTVFNMGFSIDYIDFENATIGGYYVMDASGNMQGKRMAYGLIRFSEPTSGMFDLTVVPPVTVSEEETQNAVVQEESVVPQEKGEEACPPCVIEQIRDDEAVRLAIDAAARAEAEAKAAAEKAIQLAEEAAQTTNEYALKKAQEAEKAKQEAQKAAEMAAAARGRVDSKVAAMNCQEPDQKNTEEKPVEQSQSVPQKKKQTVTTQTTTITRINADGTVVNVPVATKVVETVETRDVPKNVEVAVETVTVEPAAEPVRVELQKTEESFSQRWNRWMDKASKVFWLEEPLF